ncbi:MAG: transcriptional repressor [Bacillota bacterium]
MAEELIRKLTTEAEFRLTKQRKYILKELVDHQKEHLIAEDIYKSLKDKGFKVGLATIYRTLDARDNLEYLLIPALVAINKYDLNLDLSQEIK